MPLYKCRSGCVLRLDNNSTWLRGRRAHQRDEIEFLFPHEMPKKGDETFNSTLATTFFVRFSVPNCFSAKMTNWWTSWPVGVSCREKKNKKEMYLDEWLGCYVAKKWSVIHTRRRIKKEMRQCGEWWSNSLGRLLCTKVHYAASICSCVVL